VYIDNVAKLI